MFKIGKYILLGVWLMLSIFVASAQTFDYAAKTSLAPSGAEVGETPADGVEGSASDPYKACPSYDAIPSTSIFSIPFDQLTAGEPEENEFVWVVYGGTITVPVGASVIESDSKLVDIVHGINRSYVRYRGGVNALGDKTSITVTWDAFDSGFDLTYGWVAAQQHSQWSCTDSKWSLYQIEIKNDVPTFVPSPDLHIAYDQRGNGTDGYFMLPAFTVTDPDNCPAGSLVYSYVVDRPTLGDLTGTDSNLLLSGELEMGVNTVTWTVVNGNKTITNSYDIIVEPKLEILNVAWINPSCAGGNGSVRVSNVTNDPLNPFSVSITYSLSSDGGTTWSTWPWQLDPYFGSLAAGTYQIKASLLYNPGPDEFRQESEFYEFTLHAMAASAIQADGIPSASPDLTLKPTSCGNASDGAISMDPTKMIPQNSSVTFDGVDDHLLVNKTLSGEISEFSVALWVNTTVQNGTLISFDNNEYFNLALTFGQLQLRSASTDGALNTVLVSNAEYAINDGVWHLVVATFGAGVYTIYVDGDLAQSITGNGASSIGKVGAPRYGAIGAVLKSSTFPDVVQAPFFNGQMAEVAYWEHALTPAEVVDMKRLGISNVAGKKDHWVLNDTPETISPAQAPVFTDAGNGATGSDWARFYNGPVVSETNVPKLYSWDDDATAKSYTRTGLAKGDYTLHVRDLFGCANVEKTFTIPNGDDEEPYLLWNVSAQKTARQSSIVGGIVCDSLMTAGRAADGWLGVDGCSYTTTLAEAGVESWWDVTLGLSTYPVDRVRVHPESALTNFWVIVSSSDFTVGSSLADDLAKPGVTSILYDGAAIVAGGSKEILFPTVPSGQYVRIRMANPNEALSLYEVEVLTSYKPATERKLLLTDDCPYYTISNNDATVDPIPVDGCGNTPSLTHDYAAAALNTTLEGVEWALGPHTVTWTAVDENGMSTPFEMTYHVKDEIKPVFVEDPFNGLDNDLTYCEAQTFQFKIPKVTDNYTCNKLVSISLLRDGFTIYSIADMTAYNPADDNLVPPLPASMLQGSHNFVWRATDAQGNFNTTSFTIFIQQQPILQEVKVSPITCHGLDNGVVYFSKVVFESSKTISYILKKTSDGTEIPSSDPVFEEGTVPPGTYQAYIQVDGCRTPTPYFEDIVISDPDEITTVDDITHVTCYGETTGAIDIDPLGGSQTNVLHLIGPDTYVLAPSYSTVELSSSGSVEAWIYLDDLVAAGTNAEAGIFGLPNGGSGYGFKMVGGDLTFYVESENISLPGIITARKWFYVLGTWNGTGTRSMTIEVRDQFGFATSDATTPTADFGAICAGDIYLGSLGDGDDTHNLRGFVRSARIWDDVLIGTIIDQNLNLSYPLDPNSHLVANYPVNGSGGNVVGNASNSSALGSVQGTYARQKFAFYWTWTDVDGNPQVANSEDITTVGAGNYQLVLSDPLGCSEILTKTILTDDKIFPTMNFYSNHDRNLTLGIGQAAIRYTGQTDWGNLDDDCEFIPSALEFDPIVIDGLCDPDYVTLAFELVAGSDAFLGVAPAADASTLDGSHMTGAMTLKWTATDKNGQSTEREVTYYIVDDEAPTSLTLADAVVSVPAGECSFTVPNGAFIPALIDNCGTGIWTNDLTGGSNLDGEILGVGSHVIHWTYTDRILYPGQPAASISFTHTIVVEDNNVPTAVCVAAPELHLDAGGTTSIESLDLAGSDTEDNCGNISQLAVTRNVAYGILTATQSGGSNENNALDHNTNSGTYALTNTQDNPWWQIDLGASHSVLGVRLFAGDGATLENFWILVSTDGTFANTGDWTPSGAVFGADVAYAQYYAGTIAVSDLVGLNKVSSGQYVRIVMNATDAQLCLAEVEVYGTTNLPAATSLQFDCQDIRYIPDADPAVKGTFYPINVLLTAIDDNFNAGSCLGNVTVRDDVPPIVTVTNAAIPLSDVKGETINLNSAANIALIDAGSTDNCTASGNLERWVTPADPVTCTSIGSYPVTFHVRDQYANTSDRAVVVTINDVTAPVMTAKTPVAPATWLELPLGPDGFYEVQVSDLIADWDDNCSDDDQIKFKIDPDTVDCSLRNQFIDISITAIDGNGQESTLYFLRDDADFSKRVQVVDKIAPTFSLSGYTHTIPSTGSAAIFFDDIVKDGNLHDNCTDRADLLRYIRYEEGTFQADEWCGYGSEGGGVTALSNLAAKAVSITGSDALSGYPGSNAYDNNPPSTSITADQTYFATNAISGERTIQYNFAKKYEFERIEALWADIPSADGNSALSHNDTYMPSANITASGGAIANKANVRDGNNATTMAMQTGTAGADAFTIQYTFTQPVMVANVRLRWAAGSTFDADTRIEYETSTPGTWALYSTIANTSSNTTISTINATASITKIRLVYDPAAGNTPAIAEWYVYGQACAPYAGREVVAAGTTLGNVMVSHVWDYLKAVTFNSGSDVVYVNDDNGESTYYNRPSGNTGSYAEWVEYEFYAPISFTSTEVYWGNYEPSAVKIQYWNGSAWTDISNPIGRTNYVYNSASMSGVVASRIRIAFTNYSNWATRIYNWRVYGTPCASVTIPSIINGISTNSTYLDNTGVTVSTNSAGTIGYLRDNNLVSNPFVVSATTSTSWDNYSIQYSFKEEIILTSFNIYWTNLNNRIANASIQYESGGSWYDIVSSFTPSGNYSYTGTEIKAQNFRIQYQARYRNSNSVLVYEWLINGYPVSGITSTGCWTTNPTTLYNCPTSVTTQLPVILPTTASVQYSNDLGASWSSPIVVNTVAFPTSVNNTSILSGGNPVEANAIKLTFDNTSSEGNIGLYEFRTFGRRIPQPGDETVEDACYTYTCANVNTNTTVHLKAVDESGNSGETSAVVAVEPYFKIANIDIKDCGYSGERYYPTLSGLSSTLSYTYTWSEIDDFGTNAHQSLFLSYHDPALGDACPRFPVNDLTTYTMPNPGQEWIELNTSACGTNVQTGTYRIKLKVQDSNSPGCWSDLPYDFDYDGANSTAKSIDSMEYCIGDIETFKIKFPINDLTSGLSNNQFWRQSTKRFYWYDIDNAAATSLGTLVSAGLISIVSGGNSVGESGSTYGDNSVTVRFDKATVDYANKTTDINYSYRAEGLHPYDVSISSTSVQKATVDTYVGGYTLVIVDSLQTGGPYFTEDNPQNNHTILAGEKYIRLSTSSGWWYGDYGACMEKRIYRNTIFKVEEPIIEATRDIVPNGSSVWVTLTGSGVQPFDICVRDTITYRVQNYTSAQFSSLEWSYGSNETTPEPTGYLLSGGNDYDQFIQLVWSIYEYPTDPVKLPRLTVKGVNKLGCSGAAAVVTHTFNDITPPVLGTDPDNNGTFDCTAMDRVIVNAPTQCAATIINLPAPAMTDDCHNRIANYWCEVDTNLDGTPDITEKNAGGYYPVGVHEVKWYATDYSSNKGTCTQTITVLDAEAPSMSTPPNNIDNLVANVDCEHVFVGVSHDVTANDKCKGVVDAIAKVYRYNSGSGLYDILASNQPPAPGTSLDGTIFESGKSRIEWTTTDGVDNSLYGGAYDSEGNKSSLDFYFTVVDKTAPTVADNDGVKAGIQLVSILADSDPTRCGVTLTIPVPGYDSGGNLTDPDNLLDDNCSLDTELSVAFVSRSDKALDLTTEFPVGTTTITWRVSDAATPPNRTTFYQDVTVTDVEAPDFMNNTEFADRSVSYCARNNYKISIPRSYADNCKVTLLDYKVVNVSSGVTVYSGSIDGALYPSFNPLGTGYLAAFSFTDVNVADGSDYIVTWTATDAAGNKSDDATWNYNLHIEMEPHYVEADVVATPMDCGGGTATITVSVSNVNVVGGYRYDRNYGYTPEYSIGLGWQASNSFTVNSGGEYTVKMRVNGCEAPEAVVKTIVAPDAYNITTTKLDVVCPEKWEGKVSVAMSGGVPGQLVFSGTGYTAAEYLGTDLTTVGAVESWVYLNSLSDATILSKGTAYGLQVVGNHFALFVGGDQVAASTYNIATKHWYHVSGWWDASGLSISVDGSAASTLGGSYSATLNDDPITLGGTNFQGILREARIWSTTVSGAIPSEKIKGDATGLVGFWDMNEGSGIKASNLCNSFGGIANHAFGGSGLWTAGQPQPGSYSWNKNSNSYSTYGKSNIELTGLEIGTYTVSFVDPYGCAATSPSFKKVVATDNKLPTFDYTTVSTAVALADFGECSYLFDLPSEVTNYTPVISDATGGGCNFTTTWKVVQDYTKETLFTSTGDQTTDLKLMNAMLKKVGTNGKNTVYITVSQNGMVSEVPEQYDIVVGDNQKPTPDARFNEGVSMELDNTLYGGGKATYTAAAFNRNSTDNCTKDPALLQPRLAAPTTLELPTFDPNDSTDPLWKTEVEFYCEDRGKAVSLYFGVKDESGNWDWITDAATFDILDKYSPEFIKTSEVLPGVCATENANAGVPAYTTFDPGVLILKSTDYTDNCGVTKVWFKLKYLGTYNTGYNDVWVNEDTGDKMADDAYISSGIPIKFYEGKTEVSFRLFDESGNPKDQLIYTVTVLPKPIPGSGGGIQ